MMQFGMSLGLRYWKECLIGAVFLVSTAFLFFFSYAGDLQDQASTTGCGPTSLVGSDNAQQIWNYLRGPAAGLSPIAAAAVEGNLRQESQLNPAESGGGLAQWSDPSRWANLQDFAIQNHADPNALNTQLAFLMQEVKSGSYLSLATLNSMDNVAAATIYVEANYERAGIPMIDRRINYATEFYNQYSGAAIPPITLDAACAATPVNATEAAQKVTAYGEQFLGVPYVWGGADPSGFDCSGLMQYIFKNALGINLPRVAEQQQLIGTRVDPSQVQPGDLVFMGFPAFHVGLYIGGGKWLEAPETGDVVKIANYNPASFTSATRVIN